jgi:hypothetical protein
MQALLSTFLINMIIVPTQTQYTPNVGLVCDEFISSLNVSAMIPL